MTKKPLLNTVTLSKEVDIDGEKHKVISVRKPKSGELRGTKLVDLMQMDVIALIVVLPRITQPPLSPQQASDLDLVDMTKFGTKIIGFFGDMSAADPAVSLQ